MKEKDLSMKHKLHIYIKNKTFLDHRILDSQWISPQLIALCQASEVIL